MRPPGVVPPEGLRRNYAGARGRNGEGKRGEGRGAGEKDEGSRMKDEREVSGGERSMLKLAA